MGFSGGAGMELKQDEAIGGDYEVKPLDGPGFRNAYTDVLNAYQSAGPDIRSHLS